MNKELLLKIYWLKNKISFLQKHLEKHKDFHNEIKKAIQEEIDDHKTELNVKESCLRVKKENYQNKLKQMYKTGN